MSRTSRVYNDNPASQSAARSVYIESCEQWSNGPTCDNEHCVLVVYNCRYNCWNVLLTRRDGHSWDHINIIPVVLLVLVLTLFFFSHHFFKILMQNSHNNRQLGNSPGSSNRLNNLPSSHRNQPSRHSLNSSQSPSGNNNTIYNYFSPSYIPPPPPETLSSSPYTRKSTSAAFNSLTAIPSTSSPVPSPYVAHNRSSTQPRAPGVNQIDHSSSNTLSNSNNALVNPVRYPENSNSKIDCKIRPINTHPCHMVHPSNNLLI